MAHKTGNKNYSVNLTFEEIGFPPFHDILVVAKDCVHGKLGLCKCFEYLAPNGFKMVEINDNEVDVVFVSYKILKKIPVETVIKILAKNVFPFLSSGEILKVSFDLKIHLCSISEEL